MSENSTFDPTGNSIIKALFDKPFSVEQKTQISDCEVRMEDVARIEIKLWLDFCESIEELELEKSCIDKGRELFLENIIGILLMPTTLDESIKRAQVCSARAGATTANNVLSEENPRSIITPDDYEKGCAETRKHMFEVFKRLNYSPKALKDVMVPVCDPEDDR